MIIDLINKKYANQIQLSDPADCEGIDIPESLKEILRTSNGIQEIMTHPKTGESLVIGWIIYPLDEMIRSTSYYHDEYGITGTVFTDDGAGNPYYISEGKVFEFDPIDNESYLKSESLADFFA